MFTNKQKQTTQENIQLNEPKQLNTINKSYQIWSHSYAVVRKQGSSPFWEEKCEKDSELPKHS